MDLLNLFLASVLATSSPAKAPTLTYNPSTKLYSLTNPGMNPATVQISCQGDYDPIRVHIPARTRLALDLQDTNGYVPECKLTQVVEGYHGSEDS